MRKESNYSFKNQSIMAQTGISNGHPESMINIFPNPCIGDTYLYTDDLEAAWVVIYDLSGSERARWAIDPGKTLHVHMSLGDGTYQLILKDAFQNKLGSPKTLYISASH
jgi:hypothetical protein